MMFFLGRGFRVIARDRRGHCRSAQVANGHDMDHYAEVKSRVTRAGVVPPVDRAANPPATDTATRCDLPGVRPDKPDPTPWPSSWRIRPLPAHCHDTHRPLQVGWGNET